ncbi:MAG: 23S rRNA (adenine(2503)-C(2))-methyltransferase RlmN [Planctomycetia bacterium]|nr:23S rRNA (adenine(2503)-C(2))-methyltransferase RlmN [Planctomycetia bacterium]
MPFLLDLPTRDLEQIFSDLNLPAWRLKQVRRWIFARRTFDFNAMTDLSKDVRATLAQHFSLGRDGSLLSSRLVTHTGSSDAAEKILLEFPDGHCVESVLLRDDRDHRTACVSTQVGCQMGCVFCASGMDGFIRNLTRGEILEQILRLNALLPDAERLTHLVVMGTGEPMLNLPALLPALAEITSSDGFDLANRRVTVSTVGIPDGIRAMAAAHVPYKLAISLHAPNDVLRSEIVPQNRHVGIQNVLAASDDYFRATGRRVTFEYILIDQCNSSRTHALELANLLRGRTAIVNLIPYNAVAELPYKTPSAATVAQFARVLEEEGIQVKVRFRKGDKIDAACGQLRRAFRARQEN